MWPQRLLAAACAAFLGLSASVATAAVTRGPIVQDPRADRVTLLWETDAAQAAVLEVRGAGVDLRREIAAEGTHYEVVVDGLARSERYEYTLTPAGQAAMSGRFATLKAKNEPFSFLVYGDNRSDHDQHRTVVAAMQMQEVDFLLNTGDLVSDGEREDHWQHFFDIEGPLLRNTPIYPSIGNHDEFDGRSDIYDRVFALPTESSGTEHYYAFTYGNARFLMLDGEVEIAERLFGALTDFSDAQLDWIRRELASARQDPDIQHIFVALHRGPFSSKPGRNGNLAMRNLIPDFQRAGVSMLLSGHDHYFERGETPEGMPYMIVGGGGAPLYETRGPRNVRFPAHTVHVSQSALSFARIDVEGGQIRVQAIGPAGDILDSVTFGEVGPAQPECRADADCNRTPEDCVADNGGNWLCQGGLCRWACEPEPPPLECTRDEDCVLQPPIGADPAGSWTCNVLGACAWIPVAQTPECDRDIDCAGRARPSMVDCEGEWICPDSTCEWRCSQPPMPEMTPAPTAPASPTPRRGKSGGCASSTPPRSGLGLLVLALVLRRRQY